MYILAPAQRQHHGEDWGEHVLPNIFDDQFFNSSKSEEKYLGGVNKEMKRLLT